MNVDRRTFLGAATASLPLLAPPPDQTLWTAATTGPEVVTLDLGRVFPGVDVLTYLPRQDTAVDYVLEDFTTTGDITSYRISTSLDGTRYREVARASWPPTTPSNSGGSARRPPATYDWRHSRPTEARPSPARSAAAGSRTEPS
ncbi:discoidin domain-containing protein [Spirillospora sp. NPDC047279]|uniref:discoidin domain-containing protein n=1 Tax=Spirillospora sp. NPDC047279 TaxID=3155478 RepID=UPI0033C7A488